jgi:hypothetical protein
MSELIIDDFYKEVRELMEEAKEEEDDGKQDRRNHDRE